MKKEFYIKQKETFTGVVQLAKDKLAHLDTEYIKANAQHEVGDKVVVTFGGDEREEGFIYNRFVGALGDVEYTIRKADRYGKMSRHTLYYARTSKIMKYGPKD